MKQLKSMLIICLLALMGITSAKAADTPVKREFRATWIATVWRLDWPSSLISGANQYYKEYYVKQQKAEMTTLLDSLQTTNFNAVTFQVRGRADAFYKSSYEPWSSDLVSTRGMDPGYDPLEFVVEECHKRGMECHAWINPYRYESVTGQWNGLPGCYRTDHPDWIIDVNGASILNPGKAEVTQRICDIIKEIVQNYDVDGIIFDDYFYLKGISDQDADQYSEYTAAGGTLSLANWRRNNVNNMVKSVHSTINSVKPGVSFGISPAGIACTNASLAKKYGISACPTGSDWQYDGIYSEPVQWLKDHSIDFISPQVYWTIGNSTDYEKAVPWWSTVANTFNRHLYVSHSITSLTSSSRSTEEQQMSRIEESKISQKADGPNGTTFAEYANEVRLNRSSSLDGNPGSIFWSAKYAYKTAPLFGHYLRVNVFNTPALRPAMTFKAGNNPGLVKNITLSGSTLTWNGYDNVRYTVYAVPTTIPVENFQKEVEYLLGVTYTNSYTIPSDKLAGYNYAVCVYDRVGNEYSATFAGVATEQLPAPTLKVPSANQTIEAPFIFEWNAVGKASVYTVEVSTDSQFKTILATGQTSETSLSSSAIESLPLDTQLYWRVRSMANNCIDGISAAVPFKVIMIHITSPTDGATGSSLTPTITWSPNNRTVNVQISTTITFDSVVWEKESSTGSCTVEQYALAANTKYYVRLVYTKDGETVKTDPVGFKTLFIAVSAPTILFPTEGCDFYGTDVMKVAQAAGVQSLQFEICTSSTFPARSIWIKRGNTGEWESPEISKFSSKFTEGKTYYFRALAYYVDSTDSTVKTDYSPVISAVYKGAVGAVEDIETSNFAINGNVLELNGILADVKVYNAAGVEILAAESNSSIDLSKLSVGLYLVKVATADKTVTLKHIVK